MICWVSKVGPVTFRFRFSELAKPRLPMKMGTPGHCCNLLTGMSSSHACVSETCQGCGQGLCFHSSAGLVAALRDFPFCCVQDKVSRAVGSMASFLCCIAYAKSYSTIIV